MRKRQTKPSGYWTKQRCIKEGKKYKTRITFKKQSSSAYCAAHKLGIIEKCCKHMNKKRKFPVNYWTEELCLKEALKYYRKKEFMRDSPGAYNAAYRLKIIKKCCTHMNQTRKYGGYWTLKRCKEEALKYKFRGEWQTNSSSSYVIARRNKWLDKCCKHMEVRGCLYNRKIYAVEFPDNSVYIGLSYDPIKRFYEHKKCEKSSAVYKYFKKTKLEPILKIISKNFISPQKASETEGKIVKKYKKEGWVILNKAKTGSLGGGFINWTKEKCLNEAIKYKTRKEYKINSNGSYNAACRNKWLDECCEHMEQ